MAMPERQRAGARYAVLNEVKAWRWIGLYIGVALLLPFALDSHLPVEAKRSYSVPAFGNDASGARIAEPGEALGHSAAIQGTERGQQDDGWVRSEAMILSVSDQGLLVQAPGPSIQFASRRVDVPSAASFVRLSACFGSRVPPDSLFIAFASIADRSLDFNRAYRLWTDDGGDPGDCFEGLMPRRSGDADAILQILLQNTPGEFVLTQLTTEALVENPRWRWLRVIMLTLGIGLIAVQFRRFTANTPRWSGAAGGMVVAAIVFGCCVSVDLKADIFALATGGRAIDVPQTAAHALHTAFPTGGFSIFTLMHGVLFAAATFLLGLGYRYAWVSLLLLGATTETLQIFVPGRGPGLSDMLVDWSGVAAGVGLLFLFRRGQGKGLLLKE